MHRTTYLLPSTILFTSIISVDVIRQRTPFDLSSLAHALGISGGRRFILKSFCNQLGPNLHNSFAASSTKVNLHDGMSVGLVLPEQ